jgi:hypothetical protein
VALENYIIRIYRRDASDPERLSGLLESVERETRYSFQTVKELRELLAPANEPKRSES